MRDLLTDYERFAAAGSPFGRAVVTSVWGSAPRAEGACLLASADGKIAGSVSGGCVETATALEIAQAIETKTPKLVTFGVSHERAWEVGLACGGTIKVFVEPSVRPEILEAAQGPGGVVVASVIEGPGVGSSLVVRDDGTVSGQLGGGLDRDAVRTAAGRALAREASSTLELTTPSGTARIFLEVFPRQPTLLIFGGVHIAAALVPLAKTLGYRVVVADGREAFLGRERFPLADELVLAWPQEAFEKVGIDPATYICVLSHDPKFDEPALEVALRSRAAYVGAIGSRKTQVTRRERLRAGGITDEQLARLRGPIGLDLGGRQPAETALAILAEMTAARYGGSARALGEMTTGG
ncbi:MAG TPA: XdhC/CoxI family protein [Gemmatimonadales bacterium]|nr:XdhC/CoxI family protein [Gemmatimonadales bacterium]